MAKFVQCSAHSCSEPQQATWFLVAATGLLEPVTQQHQQPRNLLHTRVEVPGKLQLFQLSTLRSRHSSLIWPFASFAKMEMAERMVLWQWLLADACMSALSSVLVIDMNWIAAWKPHQLAIFQQYGKISLTLCCLAWTGTGNLLTKFLEAVMQQYQQQNNLSNTRFEVSNRLKLPQLSTFWRRQMETVVTGWHLHAFSLFRTGDWYEMIWTGLLHGSPINW